MVMRLRREAPVPEAVRNVAMIEVRDGRWRRWGWWSGRWSEKVGQAQRLRRGEQRQMLLGKSVDRRLDEVGGVSALADGSSGRQRRFSSATFPLSPLSRPRRCWFTNWAGSGGQDGAGRRGTLAMVSGSASASSTRATSAIYGSGWQFLFADPRRVKSADRLHAAPGAERDRRRPLIGTAGRQGSSMFCA